MNTPTNTVSRENAGNSSVGYGRPPVATRFKPGQSGNPKGAKPGSRRLTDCLRRELEKELPCKNATLTIECPELAFFTPEEIATLDVILFAAYERMQAAEGARGQMRG